MSALTAICNGILWSTALALAVLLILRLTPRRALDASARYAIWWLTLAAVLAAPLLRLPSTAANTVGVRLIEVTPLSVPPVERIPIAPAPQPGPHALSLAPGRWLEVALALWLLAAAFFLVRLALGLAAMHRVSARAGRAPEPWPQRLAQWKAAVRAGSRRITVAASEDIAVPAAAGPHRPAILIPARLFEELSFDDLDRVGLHEAAHLARRDDCALLLQRAIEAVLWPHPAVRLIARQLDLEREIACDDRVVDATGEPRAYAACLTRVVALCGTRGPLAVPTMADNRTRLSRRVELLVARRSLHPTWPKARFVVAAAALGVMASALFKAPAVIAFTTPAPPAAMQLVQQPTVIPSPATVTPEKPMNYRAKRIVHLATAAIAAVTAIPAAEPPQQLAPPAAAPQAVLYFDKTQLSPDLLTKAVQASHKFVGGRPQAAVTAIMAYDGTSVRVLQDFTSDAAHLNSVLDTLIATQDNPIFNSTTQTDRLAALGTVTHLLGAVAGKKAIVEFVVPTPRQDGDDAQLRQVIDAAIKANVAFYPIDARGPMNR